MTDAAEGEELAYLCKSDAENNQRQTGITIVDNNYSGKIEAYVQVHYWNVSYPVLSTLGIKILVPALLKDPTGSDRYFNIHWKVL